MTTNPSNGRDLLLPPSHVTFIRERERERSNTNKIQLGHFILTLMIYHSRKESELIISAHPCIYTNRRTPYNAQYVNKQKVIRTQLQAPNSI